MIVKNSKLWRKIVYKNNDEEEEGGGKLE